MFTAQLRFAQVFEFIGAQILKAGVAGGGGGLGFAQAQNDQNSWLLQVTTY